MNVHWVEVAVGVVAFGYGAYSLYARITAPERIDRLSSMKRVYGAKAGSAVHLAMYSIIPIAFGLILVVSGFLGVDIFRR
jgi:hypothetical protein